MRQLIIDTETTGLFPKEHRIIELAALEVVNRRATGRSVHYRVDPEREIDAEATGIHGMTWEDLKGRPRFRDVAREFVDFATGAEWVIHNAPFDLSFLDEELARAGLPPCASIQASCVDTLALARDMFPGKRNSLDALCERFGVSNAHRTLHGALLDAELLAEVYLAMTRGQESLTIDIAPPVIFSGFGDGAVALAVAAARVPLRVIAPTAAELEAHQAYLSVLDEETKGRCLWLAQFARAEAAIA